MDNKYSSEILLHAASLGLGERVRKLCPVCEGGTNREDSLSIYLSDAGILRWICFRDSCTLGAGSAIVSGGDLRAAKPTITKPKRRMFLGETQALREKDREWIKEHWGIESPPYWYYTQDAGGRIAMSVRSPTFKHRGWVLRDITGTQRTKALTYIDEGEHGLSWYKEHPHEPTIIVEDIPSAVRASEYMNSVALLGTGIGVDRALEIESYATRPIILALDPDATATSFKWAQKYALLWGDVQVLPLQKDIKNTNKDELCDILKSFGTESDGKNLV